MKLTSYSVFRLACFAPSLVRGKGLIGIEQDMYSPACAYACRGSIAASMLSCSTHNAGAAHAMPMTSPKCRAGDSSFLTTLAWCINSKCTGVPTYQLEQYWYEQTTGDPKVLPKWDYSTALSNVAQPPERVLNKSDTLNYTALVSPRVYGSQFNTLSLFAKLETRSVRYGLALLLTGFGVPILFTALGFLPYMTGLLERLKPYIVYPSAVGTYQVRPLPYYLGNAPTTGQSLYIALLVILTVVFCAINYGSTYPEAHAWNYTRYQESMAYVMYRTGLLGFAVAPLVFLFAGRNNILLWVTNWSHSTFLLLHRWVALLFIILSLLHSILALRIYVTLGTLSTVVNEPYWIWGAVATVAVSIMLVASRLYVRRLSYEIFLVTHILLAVLVVVGCWYHVEFEFSRKWGYEVWLYAVCAVWFADRALRVLRVATNGVRRARVADVGGGAFVRVDVDGIRWAAEPGRHVYAYFPTLSPLRPWENHPFSVLPTALLRSPGAPAAGGSNGVVGATNGHDAEAPAEDHGLDKSEKANVQTKAVREEHTTAGLTLFIRKSTGLTKYLQAHDNLLTLLDGPYPNNPTGSVLQCDRLLLIGGGIGITGLLPWVNSHSNIKLCWSVKESAQCLVKELDGVLSNPGFVDKDVRIGRRLDIAELLKQEIQDGWHKVGIVVCGPGGLCDDVRAAVVAAGRKEKTVFELEVDAYSW